MRSIPVLEPFARTFRVSKDVTMFGRYNESVSGNLFSEKERLGRIAVAEISISLLHNSNC